MTTRRFKPYQKYNESGIDWLGKIPSHWMVYPLRRKLFREPGSIKIGPFGSQLKLEFMTQNGFKVYGQEHVIARDFNIGSKYVDQTKFSELAVCEIRPNDLIITMMGSSGRCAVVPRDIQRGIMDSHLLRIRLPDTEVDPRFLCLLIDESPYVKDQIGALGKGAIMHGLNSSIIKGILLAVPPESEQLKILAFLDRETAKIDALLAKKARLIELLQEKRVALITQAVTKGLDPNVPMKDSGVEWLGKIPAHWRVKRVRHLALGVESGIQMGPFGSMLKEIIFSSTGYKLYGQENTISGDFEKGSRYLTELQYQELHQYWLRPDDIIVTRKGSIGNARIVPREFEPGIIDSDTIRIRVDDDVINPHFFTLLLHEGSYVQQQIEVARRGAVLSGLNTSTIADLILAVPERDEQTVLLEQVSQCQSRMEALIQRIRDAVDSLIEFRSALISAAVTGKIDVREEVV